MSPLISILTPTWNRRHLLPRLYESLSSQDAPPGSFEWLVIDDGSTDGTVEWLKTLRTQASFPIRLFCQENGGKHRALNRAASELRTPWVVVVDSDDWLLPLSVVRSLKQIERAPLATRAIIAPLFFKNKPIKKFNIYSDNVNFREWMEQKRWVGDTSYIIRSIYHKENRFPEFPEEKFMSEGFFYASIFHNGGIRLSNEPIVGAEYQPGGLSAMSLQLRSANPLGALANYEAHLKAGLIGSNKIRNLVNYHRFLWHARCSDKNPEKYGFTARKLWLMLGYFPFKLDLWRLSRANISV
ncbi:glycosyltransferase family 2 protein [Qipengyuania citrea]|uniref:glycosyltransferase family 2 protein n=1 Tax=Qipengyuania citrea TaxID=225971 RepID=UPI00329A6EE3